MGVLTDPRYQRLAAIAGQYLGAGPNVRRAILAQFASEKAGEWPPQDNSPGNVHVGPLSELGLQYPGGVGDRGQVARLPTPEVGAYTYAAYIAKSPLYAQARVDIAHDNGLGFINDVARQGYGTNLSDWLLNFGRAPDPLAGSGGSSGSGINLGSLSKENPQHDIAAFLGKSITDTLTAADVEKLVANYPAGVADQVRKAYSRYIGQQIGSISTDALGNISANFNPLNPAQAQADIAAIPGQVATAAIQAAVPFVVEGTLLIGILVVGYLGLKRLVGA